jgi:hypothetical protein
MATPDDHDVAIPTPIEPAAPHGHPFDAEIEAERVGWYELLHLVRALDTDATVKPGYYRDPDWSVATLIGHVGTWLAMAGIQLERIGAGTYERNDVDIDALNAQFRAAMIDQPWDLIFTQAQASRSRLLEVWYALPTRTDAAAWWVAKVGADHYREHLPRLREWVALIQAGDGS